MPLPDALQRFVADELTRLPALVEQVRRQTADALRQPVGGALSPAERMQRFDTAQALDLHAQRFNHAFVNALARHVQAETPTAAAATAPAPSPRGLELLDEAAHGADIEIARIAALIASAAEWELRELQTYTSALCGLPYVSINANPLRPEAFAQALWQAADALPLGRTGPLLLRVAARALADALRRDLAAACTRLEAQGVQPSLYRTAVPAQGERASVLGDLLDSVPGKPAFRRRSAAADAQSVSNANAATAELLTSLFDAIAQGGQMHPALRALTGLLQAQATTLARRDPQLLDDAGHPFWRLLDRFAYQSASHPSTADPQLLAWVGFAAEVVANLLATPLQEAQHYRTSVEQLDAYSAAQFNAQLQQAASDIAALQRDDPGAPALDIASMDTVPADLLAGAVPAEADAPAAAWLAQQTPGQWYRLFLRGRWTVMRLLWRSDSRARWLFAGPHPQRNDAFDHGTLVRLRAEMLIRPLVERAVVVRAAESVRRRLSDPRKAG
jgi:hypothetical protein